MYSRRTGNTYQYTEAQNKIESFNKDLRDQYRKRSHAQEVSLSSSQVKPNFRSATKDNQIDNLKKDDLIIAAIIILLLLEESTDYVLIGVLAALLFLNR